MLKADWLAAKKVFVTGGSGFLGSHLLPRLLEAGARVTALARSDAAAARLAQGVEVARGDLDKPESLVDALQGQEIIIHMAGCLFGGSWREYFDANSRAARAVAQGRSAQRVVYVSSLAAAGPCAAAPGRSEAEAPAPVSAYGWSKLMAEEILKAAFGGRLVILRPPIIYGSGDKGLLPLFKCCAKGIGLSPGLREFPVSAIHADDAAASILLACRGDASGVYHLSDGAAHSMAAICRAIARAQGRSGALVLKPPLALMGAAAWACGAAHGLLGAVRGLAGLKRPMPPAWNSDKFREARAAGWLADGGRIRRGLGFSPSMDLERGMAEAVAGYRAEGML